MASFKHLNIMSVLGELEAGVYGIDMDSPLNQKISTLRNEVYTMPSAAAGSRIAAVVAEAKLLAEGNPSNAAGVVRRAAFRLEDIVTLLDEM